MPEVVIYNTIDSIIKVIRDEIDLGEQKENTILYNLLGKDQYGKDYKMNNVNFYKNAVSIFSKKHNLNISFGYNPEVSKGISLHILLPSDSSREAEIGAGLGYQSEETEEGTRNSLNQGFDGVYQIMITSDNSTEVLLIYHILKALLIMYYQHLDAMGLRNLKISGNDIVMREEFTPPMTFHKVINLSFFYDFTVDKKFVDGILKRIYFKLKAVEEFDKSETPISPEIEKRIPESIVNEILDEINGEVIEGSFRMKSSTAIDSKASIREAVLEKGVEIPETEPFSNYHLYIYNIQTGISPEELEEIMENLEVKIIELIPFNAIAPTPTIPIGDSKVYEFSSSGDCTWITGGTVSVELGDKVIATFVEEGSWIYTYVNVLKRKVDDIELGNIDNILDILNGDLEGDIQEIIDNMAGV